MHFLYFADKQEEDNTRRNLTVPLDFDVFALRSQNTE